MKTRVLVFLLLAVQARAGEVDVIDARARCDAQRTCTIEATLRHADTGWDHYADRWEVVGPDGSVLATRVLRHPHVGEQPFTRGLRAVSIPAGTDTVTIRAHDSVHGLGGRSFTLHIEPSDAPAPNPR